MSFHVPNKYRVRKGMAPHAPHHETDDNMGNNGAFYIPPGGHRPLRILCIASDGSHWEELGYPMPAWEHVSVSTAARCPTWDEMCVVKGLFWDDEDVVMQLHPRKSEYVNCHPYCLHLWRPIGVVLPTPPFITVGPQPNK